MEEWQKRVVAEQAELNKKVDSLKLFVNQKQFFYLLEPDQHLLEKQLISMIEYNSILLQRIARFSNLGS